MSDTNAELKIQVHIVSSVKGGCGKTAFSIFKALQLANEIRAKNLANRNAGVLWLDADFNGTASKKLFYGVDKKEFLGKPTIDKLLQRFPHLYDTELINTENMLCFNSEFVPHTINDYLREDIRSIKKMTVHGYAFGEQEPGNGQESVSESTSEQGKGCINAIVDFIFSSGKGSDKKMFNFGNGLPTIEIGRFTYLMRALLLKLCELGKTGTEALNEEMVVPRYEHIVIDMPPGDDAYASALLETIRKLAEEKEKDKDEKVKLEIHLYLLTTSDRGHMYAVQQNMRAICDDLRSGQHHETIYTVLNEVREEEFKSGSPTTTSGANYESCVNMIASCQRDILQEQMNINKTQKAGDMNITLKTLFCEFQKEYYQSCRDIDIRKFSYKITEVK